MVLLLRTLWKGLTLRFRAPLEALEISVLAFRTGLGWALFRGREGNVRVAEVLSQMGYAGSGIDPPEALRRWAEG